MSRRRVMVGLGALISLVFLWLALRGQDWLEIVRAFRQADYRWLIPASLLILADYGFRAWRWGVILRPATKQRLPLRILFPVLLLGFAANNVLPARAGEVWRMWGMAHRTPVRKTVVLSTLVVERVFDGFTLLFLLAVAGLVHPLTSEARMIEYGLTALFVLVFLGLLLFLFFEEWTIRIATRLMWPIPKDLRERLLDVLSRFAEGLHTLRQPQALARIIGSSLLAWGSQGLSYGAILIAFGLALPPAELFTVSILMLALINLLILIPAAPGNVGTYEAGGLLALSVAGILTGRAELATAIILVTHVLQWLLVTALGLLIAAQEGLTLAGLSTGPELTEG
ncbi:MAG: flippase-like domain-containing protein [Chloroflexota bacterium]|nr:flippase-like domain-containing protein [Chloroflexota bacterium]